MTCAREIITDALESLQVYSPGEVVSDADVARGLVVVNDMLDQWSNESMTTFAVKEQSVSFTPGKNEYTIGVGGDIDDDRPLRLVDGIGCAYILDPTNNRYPLSIITQREWNQIGNIASVTANVPMYLFYDAQHPLGILKFFPVPNIGWTAFWDSYLQFQNFDAVDNPVNLPTGYIMALKRNLAIELSPYFASAVITPALQRSAEISKANVKRTNYTQVTANYDSEIVSRSKATYNIYRDAPGGAA